MHEYPSATAVCRDFLITPLQARVLQVDFSNFAGYIHYHKILDGNIFGLSLKNKMANMGVSFQS